MQGRHTHVGSFTAKRAGVLPLRAAGGGRRWEYSRFIPARRRSAPGTQCLRGQGEKNGETPEESVKQKERIPEKTLFATCFLSKSCNITKKRACIAGALSFLPRGGAAWYTIRKSRPHGAARERDRNEKAPAAAYSAVPDYPEIKKSRSEPVSRGGILDAGYRPYFIEIYKCTLLQHS